MLMDGSCLPRLNPGCFEVFEGFLFLKVFFKGLFYGFFDPWLLLAVGVFFCG